MLPPKHFTKSASAFIILTLLNATPLYAETLQQVYQDAKKNDAQFQVSQTGYLATLEKRKQMAALLKPRIDLNSNASYNAQYTGRTLRGEDSSAFLNFGYSINLSKPLIHKELKAQTEQVEANIQQANAGLQSDKQQLIIRVAEAYFQYLKAKEALIFAKAEKNAIKRQLNQVKAYFDAGRSAITDVKEAQARYDLTIAQEVVAKQQIDLSKESLKTITSKYYKQLASLAGNRPLPTPSPNNIDYWTKTAIKNSPSIKAAQYAITAAQKKVDLERAAKSSTLDLFAKHSGSSTHGEAAFDQDKFDASVGIQFNMPLYRGGNISSKIREARQKLHQAQLKVELQKRLVTQQVRAAFTTITSGRAQINAFKQALNSTQTAAKATQAGYQAGTRTAVDVLLALRETFRAKKDYSTARYDYLLNLLKLKQAAGVLADKDLYNINKILK